MASVPPRLQPLLAHHIVNTLGWADLRPLQKQAISHIIAGEHALLVAPTAGGKTEAAILPLLSRMLEEEWAPLSVLYLCPLRALLNNLHPRIEHYAQLVGRTAGLWHGDVGESARERLRDDPPDILLTTPESIEAMLISRKTDHERFFRNVRALIVDEIHAFAGDDRGWHLLAVAERVGALAGRELQRIGLSATVGNASEILEWLTRTSRGSRALVQPAPDGSAKRPELTVDYVGNLDNAATVLSRMHRGEKRLVFVDSRARVEQLAAELRDREVETFVSHGSLGREERHAAEKAFAESRDCVIVATSTLELGIDVGDLDRVVQIDAPPSVASFLQRLGRTGRRAGASSNMLFLATREDAYLQTLGMLRAWEGGFVEPLDPPPLPLHLVVQQLLALVLQEGGVGRKTWPEWYGEPFVFGEEALAELDVLTDWLIRRGFLFEDQGILGIGEEGQRAFGGRNFIDLMAVFTEPPVLKVIAGRTEIGHIPLRLLTLEAPDGHVLLLGGRDWHVLSVDWRRGIVEVEPAERRGKIRWFGEARGLSFEICQGIKSVLAGASLERCSLSRRAAGRLEKLRDEFSWVRQADETAVVRAADGSQHWWTFGGMAANTWLATAIGDLGQQVSAGDLSIRLTDSATASDLIERLVLCDPSNLHLSGQIAAGAVERLKFGEALPDDVARRVVERRMRVDSVVRTLAAWPVSLITGL
jgi:ATP-dependent helicase Lhr and Lhr-like helicase